MPNDPNDLAHEYAAAVHAAASAGVDAEAEAQLTNPVAALFRGLAAHAGMPELRLLRESQLVGVRPDFSVLLGGRESGWVELKRPGKSLDGSTWTGREKTQWAELCKLDALIVCNGQQALIYKAGEADGEPADLPYEAGREWNPAPLAALLGRFAEMRPRSVFRVSDLAHRLAPLARLLRERLTASVGRDPQPLPIGQAKAAWAANVHEGVDDESFCNDIAQVMAYSLAIAGLQGRADTNQDGVVTLAEARDRLRGNAPVLAAALGPVLGVPGLLDIIAAELAAIERLVSVLDLDRIATSHDSRGEPWLWFYEDFLATYDPKARKQAGVYYTPTAVVLCQVRLVDHVLRERFDRRYGLGDGGVVVLDPACGSGTYPLAVIDQAVENVAGRGAAGPRQIAANLADSLIAFELLPGPYAVASLRIGQRLTELSDSGAPVRANVLLTDTLDSPDLQPAAGNLFGDAAELANERIRARDVKRDRRVMVVLGNPPYKRVKRADAGGWVLHGPREHGSLFDEAVSRTLAAGVKFSAVRSTYNLYAYFWRWALWKAFEAHGDGPAVVSFITGSSWLTGPGFVGLREIAREHGDEVWVVDLGGDNKGAQPEDNVFAIETPVAIVTVIRSAASTPAPAHVRYRRLTGTADRKLADLENVNAPAGGDDGWTTVESPGMGSALVPVAGGAAWQDHPALADVFPWQQPGVIVGRTWPIGPAPDVLPRRWNALIETASGEERAAKYVTAPTGRHVHTVVGGRPTLASLPVGSPAPPVRRFGWRSFDRQWLLDDPRLMTLDRPSLWETTASGRQVFLTSMMTNAIGTGPAATVSVGVPDFHYFANRGGKDVIPLWRDAQATEPNLAPGLLPAINATREDDPGRPPVGPEDVLAYVYALLSTPGYQVRFADELTTPGPRVPLTADPGLFDDAAAIGRRLLWLHTYGERYRDPEAGRGRYLPDVPGLGWEEPVQRAPATLADIRHDPATKALHVGDGRLSGVSEDVWSYSVSGMQIVRKWLGYRTSGASGRAARSTSPLDAMRHAGWPDAWNDELLDLLRLLTLTHALREQQDSVLAQVCEGPLIPASSLTWPGPSDALRDPPDATGPQDMLPEG